MGSLEVADAESRAIQKPGTDRVSLDYMQSRIADIQYSISPVNPVLSVAHIRVDNGFTVIGKSAPADPENFDAEYGMKLAYEDAIRQLWPLFGFALCEKRHQLAIAMDSADNGTLE
jgi:hypothetical protein